MGAIAELRCHVPGKRHEAESRVVSFVGSEIRQREFELGNGDLGRVRRLPLERVPSPRPRAVRQTKATVLEHHHDLGHPRAANVERAAGEGLSPADHMAAHGVAHHGQQPPFRGDDDSQGSVVSLRHRIGHRGADTRRKNRQTRQVRFRGTVSDHEYLDLIGSVPKGPLRQHRREAHALRRGLEAPRQRSNRTVQRHRQVQRLGECREVAGTRHRPPNQRRYESGSGVDVVVVRPAHQMRHERRLGVQLHRQCADPSPHQLPVGSNIEEISVGSAAEQMADAFHGVVPVRKVRGKNGATAPSAGRTLAIGPIHDLPFETGLCFIEQCDAIHRFGQSAPEDVHEGRENVDGLHVPIAHLPFALPGQLDQKRHEEKFRRVAQLAVELTTRNPGLEAHSVIGSHNEQRAIVEPFPFQAGPQRAQQGVGVAHLQQMSLECLGFGPVHVERVAPMLANVRMDRGGGVLGSRGQILVGVVGHVGMEEVQRRPTAVDDSLEELREDPAHVRPAAAQQPVPGAGVARSPVREISPGGRDPGKVRGEVGRQHGVGVDEAQIREGSRQPLPSGDLRGPGGTQFARAQPRDGLEHVQIVGSGEEGEEILGIHGAGGWPIPLGVATGHDGRNRKVGGLRHGGGVAKEVCLVRQGREVGKAVPIDRAGLIDESAERQSVEHENHHGTVACQLTLDVCGRRGTQNLANRRDEEEVEREREQADARQRDEATQIRPARVTHRRHHSEASRDRDEQPARNRPVEAKAPQNPQTDRQDDQGDQAGHHGPVQETRLRPQNPPQRPFQHPHRQGDGAGNSRDENEGQEQQIEAVEAVSQEELDVATQQVEERLRQRERRQDQGVEGANGHASKIARGISERLRDPRRPDPAPRRRGVSQRSE